MEDIFINHDDNITQISTTPFEFHRCSWLALACRFTSLFLVISVSFILVQSFHFEINKKRSILFYSGSILCLCFHSILSWAGSMLFCSTLFGSIYAARLKLSLFYCVLPNLALLYSLLLGLVFFCSAAWFYSILFHTGWLHYNVFYSVGSIGNYFVQLGLILVSSVWFYCVLLRCWSGLSWPCCWRCDNV